MQVTETSADGLKREFKVVVARDEIEQRIEDRLEELRHSVRLPGFRPGKVPVSLLRKRFGESIRGEVLEQALEQTSTQAFAEKGVRPAMQPRIEAVSFDDGADLEYTIAVELMPEIAPGDFGEIALVRHRCEAGEEDVDKAIAGMAAREKNYVPIDEDRPAESGDALVIDFVGRIDGEPFEGGSATDHVLELGSSSFIAGFEDQLVGAKPGERREVAVTFPEDYGNEALAGKQAVFEVEVKELQKAEPVVVDDAFAQSHGFADLAAVRAAFKEQIEREYGAVARGKLKRGLLDKLADAYDFPVPEGMVDLEFDAIWQRVSEARERDELDPDDASRDEDELKAEYRAIAERRVRLGLLLSEIGRLNNIDVESDELERAVMERARSFPGNEQQVLNYYRENPEALNDVRAPLFEDKVIDFIVEMASVSEETISPEDLMRDPDGEEVGAEKTGAT